MNKTVLTRARQAAGIREKIILQERTGERIEYYTDGNGRRHTLYYISTARTDDKAEGIFDVTTGYWRG